MKIFLDTANVARIAQWAQTGIVDGVTTNPTHLAKEGGDPVAVLKDICAALPQGDISVEVTQQEPEAVYNQAHALAKLAKNVTVKVPCAVQYYPVIKKLVADRVPINVTLLFTLEQGLFMAKLGVKYISPFVGRLKDIDVDGIELIQDLRLTMDQYGFDTQILAASLRGVGHLHDAILAGADVATVRPELLEKAAQHPLTQKGMEQFDQDWQKLGISQFP